MPLATGGFQVMVAETEAGRARATVLEMGGQAVDRATGALTGPSWRVARWMVPIGAVAIVALGLLRRLL